MNTQEQFEARIAKLEELLADYEELKIGMAVMASKMCGLCFATMAVIVEMSKNDLQVIDEELVGALQKSAFDLRIYSDYLKTNLQK